MTDMGGPDTKPNTKYRRFQDAWRGKYIAIPLEHGFGFGRVVNRGRLACYDLTSASLPTLDQLDAAPVLFIIPLSPASYRATGWKVIGRRPLESRLDQPVRFFREDPITGEVDIYVEGEFVPYAGEDLSRIQRLAVWHADHVVSRLNYCFFGRPDAYPDEPIKLAKYRKPAK